MPRDAHFSNKVDISDSSDRLGDDSTRAAENNEHFGFRDLAEVGGSDVNQ
jgi:hypothetical protein